MSANAPPIGQEGRRETSQNVDPWGKMKLVPLKTRKKGIVEKRPAKRVDGRRPHPREGLEFGSTAPPLETLAKNHLTGSVAFHQGRENSKGAHPSTSKASRTFHFSERPFEIWTLLSAKDSRGRFREILSKKKT